MFSTFFQVLAEGLHPSVLILLGIQLEHAGGSHEEVWAGTSDPVFPRVWWVAIGWAAADVVVALGQGYDQGRPPAVLQS